MKVRLVVVEDDPQIRRVLESALTEAGYEVFAEATGRAGLSAVAARRADALLLDLGLPDLDGLDVLRAVRAASRVPVIILSARGQETAKIEALDSGADDYVVKPFSTGELLARLRVALRHANRPEGAGEPRLCAAGVEIDLDARSVRRHGADVHLTPTEFRLLAELVRSAGKVLTHRHLLRTVWGPSHVEDTHYLRLYMAQLRQKLEADPSDPRLLLTEQGVGYRLAATAS